MNEEATLSIYAHKQFLKQKIKNIGSILNITKLDIKQQ